MFRTFAARVGWTYAALLALILATLGVWLAAFGVSLELLAGPLLVLLLVGTAVAVGVAHRLGRPLRAATGRAERIAQELAGAPPALYAADEASRLERALGQIEEYLRQLAGSRERYRARLERILDRVADGVLLVGADGRVELLNAAARRMLKLRKEAGRGRSLIEVLPDHELVELARRCARGERGADVEGRMVNIGSPRRSLRAALVPLGEPVSNQALLVLHDVTEVQRLEAVRREFVANISHELRTPLASVKMLVETLQAGGVQDEDLAQDLLERTNVELDKLTQLVRELLQLSQIESGQQEPRREWVQVDWLLARSAQRIRVQADHKRISLEVAPSLELPKVHADPDRIEQVLINLLQNAIKFTPTEGRVTLSAEQADGEVVISVADTGQGILSQDLPRVFERFYKADKARRTQGTGLGLAIAKHLVQAHGGRIWAESPGPRQGATFRFTLPAQTANDGS